MPEGAGYQVTSEQIRLGAGKFDDVTSGLTQTSSTLSSTLDSQGDCWGNDEAGQEFAKDYVPSSQSAIQAFASLTENIQALQQAVIQAAASYGNADQTANQDIAGKA